MICRTCKQDKNNHEFRVFDKGEFGKHLSKQCRTCDAKKRAELRNLETAKERRAYKSAMQRKYRLEAWLNEKDRECRVCGETKDLDQFRVLRTKNTKHGPRTYRYKACLQCERTYNSDRNRVKSYDYYTGTYLTQLLSSKWSLGQSLEG